MPIDPLVFFKDTTFNEPVRLHTALDFVRVWQRGFQANRKMSSFDSVKTQAIGFIQEQDEGTTTYYWIGVKDLETTMDVLPRIARQVIRSRNGRARMFGGPRLLVDEAGHLIKTHDASPDGSTFTIDLGVDFPESVENLDHQLYQGVEAEHNPPSVETILGILNAVGIQEIGADMALEDTEEAENTDAGDSGPRPAKKGDKGKWTEHRDIPDDSGGVDKETGNPLTHRVPTGEEIPIRVTRDQQEGDTEIHVVPKSADNDDMAKPVPRKEVELDDA